MFLCAYYSKQMCWNRTKLFQSTTTAGAERKVFFLSLLRTQAHTRAHTAPMSAMHAERLTLWMCLCPHGTTVYKVDVGAAHSLHFKFPPHFLVFAEKVADNHLNTTALYCLKIRARKKHSYIIIILDQKIPITIFSIFKSRTF